MDGLNWARVLEKHSQNARTRVGARVSIEAVIVFLEMQTGDLNAEMLELIRADSELKALDALLQSVPGVGRVVAATLTSSLPELGCASSSRLSALVGVAPMNHDSGSHRGLRFIRGGRANVRAMLYMAVQTAVKWNPALKVVYERLVGSGKAKREQPERCVL